MKQKIDLSIIIVSYNTKKLTGDCLESINQSLMGTQIKFEVIVIDNNSVDGSAPLIEKKFPEIKIIRNHTNLGFGQANNQAVGEANGEIILLLNSDTRVIGNSIETMIRQFGKSKNEIIAGGKLLNADGTPQPSCGPAYTLTNIILALFFKGDYINLTRYSPDKDREVDWVMGACMMMKRSTYEKIGGFDSKIFMYMEEIDFLHRAKKVGVKVMFFHQPRFYHVGAGSSKGMTHPIVNVFRGLVYFYKKYYPGVQYSLLRIILLLKALSGIILFSIMNNKSRRKTYLEAIRIIY